MTIKIDIEKISSTAKLKLTDNEKKLFTKDLESILNAFNNISKVNTDNIKPTFHPVEVKNITREDKVEKSLDTETALSNTKNRQGRYFLGPRAI
ncbi:MAG: Asp-tRNA(Asn)/Glu-tRNA(Gln) amidotransferase subunit GatC [Candidatus Aenigmarchaeota archaeon]|nr:Asp-tRNA(Asn)/Glu-tRNA(Gln) amidotransferase subunit GatC [Candidatus Aenigmarchaeota archaeon]MCK5322132.1 Asp-tRNA(Asn)/Glu-tRNA(Gln) amidotransferase subunit GatC [Candidatus Aenigmarchaeota archaeon]